MLVTSRYYKLNVFFSSRRRHTRFDCDWSSDVCSSDLHLTIPSGRDVVLIEIAEYMMIDSALVATAPFASVTCTVKFEVPAVSGVPLITPLPPFRLNPDGNVPAITDQLYDVLPPQAESVWL